MDTTQHLATESFSYSWLATKSSSSETKLPKNISNNNNNNNNNNQSLLLDDETTQNFNFDISTSKSNSSSLVHADKLFSNGLILARSLDTVPSKPRNKYNASSASSSPSPLLVHSKIHHPSLSSFRGIFMGKWWRTKLIPGKILSKYIKCLIPVKESIGRVDDRVNRLAWEVKSWSTNNTPVIASPMRETTAYGSAWSDIDESSVREAILYCKRSSSGLC